MGCGQSKGKDGKDETLMPFKEQGKHAAREETASINLRALARDADMKPAAPKAAHVGGQGAAPAAGGEEKLGPLGIPVGDKTLKRRNSQDKFSTKEQTVVVFDWDDTLFPTYWVRHYQSLHWRYPLESQMPKGPRLDELKRALNGITERCIRLLDATIERAHVVVVTLARPPWIKLSCDNFFPEVGKWLEKNKIEIIYAQDSAKTDAKEYDKSQFEDEMQYWTAVKQAAIVKAIDKFYSQYPGQSWKNVISIGDSDFERLATQQGVGAYGNANQMSDSKSKGFDAMCKSGVTGGHYRRVRTKTVKMLDDPLAEDLMSELSMLNRWIHHIIELDGGFDCDLDDDNNLYQAHRKLTGEELKDIPE